MPTLKRIALTDLGVFIVYSISLILTPLLALVAFIELWLFDRGDFSELMLVIKIIIGAWAIFFILGIWWSKVIQNSFVNGVRLDGKIIEFDKPVGPFFSVTYEFDFQGDRKTQRVAFINSKYTKKLAELRSITVLYSPLKNRAFIYDAFAG